MLHLLTAATNAPVAVNPARVARVVLDRNDPGRARAWLFLGAHRPRGEEIGRRGAAAIGVADTSHRSARTCRAIPAGSHSRIAPRS